MTIAGAILLFIIGIAMLWGGAEWLVKGAASFGRSLGLSNLVIGLTIVAFTTSSPECVVSLVAVLRGSEGLALGNVVGSNIANVGLVLALCAIVAPIRFRRSLMVRELPLMLGVSVLFLALGFVGRRIGRTDGVLLLGILVPSVVWMVRAARQETIEDQAYDPSDNLKRWQSVVYMIIGSAMLLAGAELMTRSGVRMAELLHVPQVLIGLTMVAVGTSLPELAASLVGMARGQSELALGNVVGSNLLNLTFVMGLASVVHPIGVPARMFRLELPVMLAFSVAVYLLMLRGGLGRCQGILLFGCYLIAITWIAMR